MASSSSYWQNIIYVCKIRMVSRSSALLAILLGAAYLLKPGYPESFQRALKMIIAETHGKLSGFLAGQMMSLVSTTEAVVGGELSVFKSRDFVFFKVVETREKGILSDVFQADDVIFIGVLGTWFAIESTGKVHWASAVQ